MKKRVYSTFSRRKVLIVKQLRLIARSFDFWNYQPEEFHLDHLYTYKGTGFRVKLCIEHDMELVQHVNKTNKMHV